MKKFMVSVSLLIMIFCKVQGLTVIVSANPDTICLGATTQLEASVIGGSLPYTYSWVSNPPGFTSGSAIPTATPAFTTWYILTVTDNAANIAKDSILVTVLYLPENPGFISGPSEICKDSIAYYTIVEAAGADSYLWTLPAGATVVEGQNTSVVAIQWGATSGILSVAGVNGCGTGTPGQMTVTIFFPPPVPGIITGPAELCRYETADFSVSNVLGASSYHWIVPPDADILNGQGFRSVKVHWGETSGTIAVACVNFCGTGDTSSKTVNLATLPSAAGVITGKADPCRGQNGYQYSVEDIPGATGYIWTLPAGASINGAQNEKQIAVDFALEAVSGSISVKGHNTCGDGTESSKQLLLNDCSGISDNDNNPAISVYPNPSNQMLNIGFTTSLSKVDFVLTDVKGIEIKHETIQKITAGTVYQVDVSNFEKGIYIIKLVYNNQVFVQKIVVQ